MGSTLEQRVLKRLKFFARSGHLLSTAKARLGARSSGGRVRPSMSSRFARVRVRVAQRHVLFRNFDERAISNRVEYEMRSSPCRDTIARAAKRKFTTLWLTWRLNHAQRSLNVPANVLSWPEHATVNLEPGHADIPGPASKAVSHRRDNSARRCKHPPTISVNAHWLPGPG